MTREEVPAKIQRSLAPRPRDLSSQAAELSRGPENWREAGTREVKLTESLAGWGGGVGGAYSQGGGWDSCPRHPRESQYHPLKRGEEGCSLGADSFATQSEDADGSPGRKGSSRSLRELDEEGCSPQT